MISMQACYRGNVARQQFKRERAARKLQAYVRGHQARELVKVDYKFILKLDHLDSICKNIGIFGYLLTKNKS